MKVSAYETEKLLNGEQMFTQLGFSMLLARLRKLYIQDSSQENLEKCAAEINAFFDKFKIIMGTDYEAISKSLKAEGVSHVLTFDEASKLINDGKLLHIAGTEALLQKLPEGSWIGGSTEYFMADDGGKISGELLLVTEFPYEDFSIQSYDAAEIANVANDSFDNGFSVVIMPYDSEVTIVYAENAASYENIFMRNIIGWISGVNLDIPGQKPIVVNGMTREVYTNKAIVLHLKIPEGKIAKINIINIFTPDENSPVIEFTEEGFSAVNCLVDGKEMALADYIEQNGIDVKLPLVGDYSGNGVNISFKSFENGVAHFYAPVFSGIKYRMAKKIPDYAAAFHSNIAGIRGENAIFSCNCVLNFLYGELEGKKIGTFIGPVTFGEIAYQLVNQTLVYVTVTD